MMDMMKKNACQFVENLLSYFYHDHDVEYVLDCLADNASWIGPAEREYYQGKAAIEQHLKEEKNHMICCNVTDCDFNVDDCYGDRIRVMGRYIVSTDESTNMIISVNQRCSFDLSYKDHQYVIHHMHISNIYEALQQGEYFPKTAGKKNYELLRNLLNEKMEQIEMINNNITGGLKGSNDDETYSFFYVSESLPRMLGYTYDEFMEMSKGSAVGMVYPPDLKAALEKVAKDFAVGLKYSAKYRVRKKDGTLIWVLDSGQKYLNENGIYKINSIITDINDMQILLDELELERERYRVALSNFEHKMFEYDIRTDEFLLYNTQNVEDVEVIKHFKTYLEAGTLIHKDDLSIFYNAIYHEDNNNQFRIYDDGKELWINIQSSLIHNSQGFPIKAIGIWKDITDEKKTYDNLVNLSQRDPLTKLYNQVMAEKLVQKQIDACKEGVLLLIDIDEFKHVNDHYGHLIGDKIICSIANILKENSRNSDIVARVGGDEFLWFMQGANLEDANQRIRLLLEIVRTTIFTEKIQLTISVGATKWKAQQKVYKDLFSEADRLLYQAKAKGKNNYQISIASSD
ncbi:MAG: diguanylate cyclase [Erysipelotrichia bacterium]|nr:diguanylate cyclase [Erysipelotrichia bacterium]NCC54203.1 diguanylate cyclase [Erysipelotrichia bacterium]